MSLFSLYPTSYRWRRGHEALRFALLFFVQDGHEVEVDVDAIYVFPLPYFCKGGKLVLTPALFHTGRSRDEGRRRRRRPRCTGRGRREG